MTWRWRALALVGLLVVSATWSLRHSEPAAAVGCDGDIAFGERINCTITNAIQVRDLTFSGNDGDVIRVRVVPTGGTVNPLTSVRFGAGVVCGPSFADEFTCELTSTGTHTLRVDSNGSGTGSFVTTIERLNDPSACTSLPYGPTGKTGAINQQVEIDCFSHAAVSVGQRWQVRVVETSPAPATLLFEVVRPNGTTVCGPTSATDSSCLLDAAGTNRIYVYASGGVQTANYRIVLEKFPTPTDCTAAAYGTTNVVNVANAGAINCFTFSGAAGDVIRARMINSTGAWEPLTDILKPDGSTACASTFADDQTCTLTTGGNHTVIVRDGGGLGERTGTGRLRLERLNDPSACTSLPYGPTGKTGAINQQVEIDCFSHAGAASGQRWQVRVVETSPAPATLLFEVVRPNGTTVCGPTSATDTSCLLDAAGTNRVYVYASGGVQTANYRIVLEKFPTPTDCTAAAYGTTNVVNVANAGAINCFTFSGAAGDVIRARMINSTGAWEPLTDILKPDGSTACASTFADDQTCTLTTGGNHTVIVRDGGSLGERTGTGRLRLERLNDPSACTSLPYGPTGKTGAINQQVEIDCFSHAGAASGQRWQVRVVETSPAPATLLFEVVRPNGTTVCGPTSATDTSCLLDAAGTNRIYVYASGGVQTANYRIVLEKFPTPTDCTAAAYGTTNVVNVANAGAINCFTFSGAAGDVIRARMINSTGAWEPLTDILKPDGSTACASTFADDQTCTLTTGGNHTVIVRDGGSLGERTGTGRLRLERLNDPSACTSLPYGPTGKTGAINQQVEIDCFSHAGAASGQRWQVRVVETSPAPATLLFEVVRPNGTTVCGPTSATDTSCLLDAAGTNRVYVYASGGVQTANYRIVLEKFPTPTDCDLVSVGDPAQNRGVSAAGAIDCVRFTGPAGSDVRVQAPTLSGTWEPLTDVLKTDGSTECGSTFADDFVCHLNTGGTHTLIVRDGGGLGERTGTYSLRLSEP